MQITNWFPYSIGEALNPDHQEYEEKYSKRCEKIKKEFKQQRDDTWVSNLYNTSVTEYKLHEDKTFKPLITWVKTQAQKYSDDLGMKLNGSRYVPKLDGAWFNFYEKNNFQEYHWHPCILSCIYYLKSNPNGARTIFKSKIYESYHIEYDNNSRPVGTCWYEPTPGGLLVFRGFMDHCVEQKTDDDDRITIAFNFI